MSISESISEQAPAEVRFTIIIATDSQTLVDDLRAALLAQVEEAGVEHPGAAYEFVAFTEGRES